MAHVGTVPGEATEYIEALVVATVQVQAEDGWEDEHHSCKVAANHDCCLGEAGHGCCRRHGLALCPPCPLPIMKPYLQGEGPQGRNGHQGSREEGNHVTDRCKRDAGAGALQTLAHALLPAHSRDSAVRLWGGATDFQGREKGGSGSLGGLIMSQQLVFIEYHACVIHSSFYFFILRY